MIWIHSYEVDIWSIGCILFTLLVGKPPFETQTLKETYKRIRANEYHVPSRIGLQAKNLIRQLLQVCFWKFRMLNPKQWIRETRLKIIKITVTFMLFIRIQIDRYFLKIFQCATMLIHVFCKSCEPEIVFCFD